MRNSHPAFESLVNVWRRVQEPPYLFPGDADIVGKDRVITLSGIDEFLKSSFFGKRKDSNFHVGLLPRPYSGDLNTAKAFVLMLNAGLHPGDYLGEQSFVKFRQAVRRNLDQRLNNERFPMFLLNPQFAWHPGFQYWSRKFQGLIEAYATNGRKSYQEALEFLSRRVCVLQLVPYHSPVFRLSRRLRERLPSSLAMKRFVREVLVPEARAGQIVLVVARKAEEWDVPRGKRIVRYEGTETRAAHLSLQTEGGKAIARQLGIA